MTQYTLNYAKVLLDLHISEECFEHTRSLLNENPALADALCNPSVQKKEKHSVIDALFSKEIAGFFKVLCDHDGAPYINEIFQCYEDLLLNQRKMLKATLTYASAPTDEQIEDIKSMLCNKYYKLGVLLELKEDPALIGGFVLTIGHTEYDKSLRNALSCLSETLAWR